MADLNQIQMKINHEFDPIKCRHYLNNHQTVIHCHHYMTLFHQLADDAKDFDGERLLKETAEDTFHTVLSDYYRDNNIESLEEKIILAEQYWQKVGMGIIQFTGVGKYAVIAKMTYSHVDQGWLDKFGPKDEPINFITCGYVSAVAALLNNRPTGSFRTRETQSIVCGDDVSIFKAVLG